MLETNFLNFIFHFNLVFLRIFLNLINFHKKVKPQNLFFSFLTFAPLKPKNENVKENPAKKFFHSYGKYFSVNLLSSGGGKKLLLE